MTELILASQSPRRQELLSWLGIPFRVVVSHFPEEDIPFEDFDRVGDYVLAIATGKALLVAQQEPTGLILSADTTVFANGKVYNKPTDLDDARRMLKELRGKRQIIATGVVVFNAETGERQDVAVESAVTMHNFSDATLEQYISTSESLGKAGAYAVQGKGSVLIEKTEGSVSSIVGLPLLEVRDLLEYFGVRVDVNVEETVFQKLGSRS